MRIYSLFIERKDDHLGTTKSNILKQEEDTLRLKSKAVWVTQGDNTPNSSSVMQIKGE